MEGTRFQAFLEAAELASGVLAQAAVHERWDEPSALEGFSVGGLAGHLYASVRIEAYVATRVVELVVHSDDLATSVALPPLAVPPTAAAVAIEIFVELARARTGDLEVIRAFTRSERSKPDILRVL
jgi:hypothetical protein